jgi:hypothetical protein
MDLIPTAFDLRKISAFGENGLYTCTYEEGL